MKERRISRVEIRDAIKSPDQMDRSFREPSRFIAKKLYFNRVLQDQHLLMVIYENHGEEILVVTIIDTSKINKYY